MSERETAFQRLDDGIRDFGLTELHTHLMGMGSADFWVSRIMEVYIPRTGDDVFYPLDEIIKASDLNIFGCNSDDWSQSLKKSALEARLFDGLRCSMGDLVKSRDEFHQSSNEGIWNSELVYLLKDDDRLHNGAGPLRAMIRNWFEFLDSSGQSPSHIDIIDLYRGKFSPQFNRRFNIKDIIVAKFPLVLAILLNTVLDRYGKAGVSYVEFSVSIKDLMKNPLLKVLKNGPHYSGYPKIKSLDQPNVAACESKGEEAEEDEESEDEYYPNSACSEQADCLDSDESCLPNPKRQRIEDPLMPTNIVENKPFVAAWAQSIAAPSSSGLEPEAKCDDLSLSLTNHPAYQSKKSTKPRPVTLNMQWRNHYPQYLEKWKNQVYRFLGAFVRFRNLRYPIYKSSTLQFEKNLPDIVFPARSYEKLYQLGFNYVNNTCDQDWENGSGQNYTPMFTSLENLAKELCSSEHIEKMFSLDAASKSKNSRNFKKLVNDLGQKTQFNRLKTCMVGFDWVGDELGHPFCLFLWDTFIEIVKKYQEYNPKFGLRIHAGEGVLRPPTTDRPSSPVSVAFTLHLYVLMRTIRILHARVKNIRIGHGVAFLHGFAGIDCLEPDNKFTRDLAEFRRFLKEENVVCELNPTSNHMLLPDSFVDSNKLSNTRTLKTFLEAEVPVVLCTDDDGIWAIHKCKLHYHHVSVAYEYCQAIASGDIKNKEEVEDAMARAFNARFS